MKYKVIKSAAHNWGHSFASSMNYWQHDYVMSHLARAAVTNAIPELHANLISGEAEPQQLLTEPVRQSLERRIADTPRFLRSHGIPPGVIHGAELVIRFDLERTRASRPEPGAYVVPFEVVVTLTDDRGTVHIGHVSDKWHTDPYGPPKRPWWRFWEMSDREHR
jgi:hypothetical protein